MSDQLKLTQESGAMPIIRLHGRLDADGAQQLRETALESLNDGARLNLMVDLAGVEFVASTGLATFLLLTEEFADVDGSIVFFNAAPAVMQVIGLLNIRQFLTLEASEEAALAAINAETKLAQ